MTSSSFLPFHPSSPFLSFHDVFTVLPFHPLHHSYLFMTSSSFYLFIFHRSYLCLRSNSSAEHLSVSLAQRTPSGQKRPAVFEPVQPPGLPNVVGSERHPHVARVLQFFLRHLCDVLARRQLADHLSFVSLLGLDVQDESGLVFSFLHLKRPRDDVAKKQLRETSHHHRYVSRNRVAQHTVAHFLDAWFVDGHSPVRLEPFHSVFGERRDEQAALFILRQRPVFSALERSVLGHKLCIIDI
ncbi:hypothetical protein CLUG_02899 [Clavispora lusitaniae ATCC 42720]|uniref:Uncharacterized protein n=1 Tax=Clavispora lusitaniae (strain ATCC 42720) TaxID=306902 RepID=C4Y2Y6_CLAL4|nr:uncharacterized protein CLUG_02899 [Clavispora lusitaniae ATCC 42720]EEQ38773.1 hypothetical protein CLUG_02899 [Clavispora lusitaniae ATCC 42720]